MDAVQNSRITINGRSDIIDIDEINCDDEGAWPLSWYSDYTFIPRVTTRHAINSEH